MTSLQPALFDDVTVPALFPDDSPRVRKSDPLTSHAAADASQAGLKDARHNILQILRDHESLTGTEINEQYSLYSSRLGWRRLSWDSPRKRAGELAKDGFLEIVGTRIADGNTSPESAYTLTLKGLEVIS